MEPHQTLHSQYVATDIYILAGSCARVETFIKDWDSAGSQGVN